MLRGQPKWPWALSYPIQRHRRILDRRNKCEWLETLRSRCCFADHPLTKYIFSLPALVQRTRILTLLRNRPTRHARTQTVVFLDPRDLYRTNVFQEGECTSNFLYSTAMLWNLLDQHHPCKFVPNLFQRSHFDPSQYQIVIRTFAQKKLFHMDALFPLHDFDALKIPFLLLATYQTRRLLHLLVVLFDCDSHA